MILFTIGIDPETKQLSFCNSTITTIEEAKMLVDALGIASRELTNAMFQMIKTNEDDNEETSGSLREPIGS